MASDLSAWMAIALIAAVTFFSRVAGAALMSRLPTSTKVERFLDGLSVSVVVAIVASVLAQTGLREAVAVALASLVMLGTRSAIWAMLAGIGSAAVWSLAVS